MESGNREQHYLDDVTDVRHAARPLFLWISDVKSVKASEEQRRE
jgi:hypothetical protein